VPEEVLALGNGHDSDPGSIQQNDNGDTNRQDNDVLQLKIQPLNFDQ
jgi:hypothetical protein